MKLEPINGISPESWNESISRYSNVMFYHHASWLSMVEDMGRGKVSRFRILDGGATVGYFAALSLKKGPFRILGSPLSTSMTEYLGPIVDDGFDVGAFLSAVDDYCQEQQIHQIEMGSPLFEPVLMSENGYETSQWMTFRIPLSSDEEEMWSNLKSKCRNRIRKGQKNDLVVEDTDDPSFVDLHYSQVAEVFSRQNLEPHISISDFRALFSRLKPAGLVYTLQVRHRKTGEVIATGVFPHGDRFAYSLSTGSWARSRNLYPNELMYWTAMCLAGKAGSKQLSVGDNYRIPGSGGKFKNKFNGSHEPVYRFVKSYSPLARYARELYKWFQNFRRQGRMNPSSTRNVGENDGSAKAKQTDRSGRELPTDESDQSM